jgi:hypothetical protein
MEHILAADREEPEPLEEFSRTGRANHRSRHPVRQTPAALAVVFGAALFLASFLIFYLEPLVGRLFLPKLGGAPVVWNTCMVFFQTTLLAGYASAHGLHRYLGSRRHALAFAAMAILAVFWLPSAFVSTMGSFSVNPIGRLLVALLIGIGLPFFVLTTTSSALQQWFAETDHPSAADPYFLYAASNAGSLLALLAYPTLIEPRLTLAAQRSWWSLGYVGFAAVALVCAAAARRYVRRAGVRSPSIERVSDATRLPAASRFAWLALSAIPSSLLLGVTTFLSTDLSPFPLLWVVPLAMYLLTFVIAFGSSENRATRFAAHAMPALAAAYLGLRAIDARLDLALTALFHLVVFFGLTLACHVRLAALRPSTKHLTEFYAWTALGGMLGGLFNALVAPVVFQGLVEYPLAVTLASATPALVLSREQLRLRPWDLIAPVLFSLLTASAIVAIRMHDIPRLWLIAPITFVMVAIYSQRSRPFRFALSIGGGLLAASLVLRSVNPPLYAERTFFGTYRVTLNEDKSLRRLLNGTTLHGAQPRLPDFQGETTTYYSPEGPIGQMFERLPVATAPGEIGVVGLGIGGLSPYARDGQRWTFYELDPAVERIARNENLFTYLARCGNRCRVVIGDARLSLQQASETYALIVVDAFSSDAIPVHLLTREALELYLSHLAPDGVLVFHVSNRHLRLSPIVARLATDAKLSALEQSYTPSGVERELGVTASTWIVLTRRPAVLDPLRRDTRWSEPELKASTPLWTDDFSNILSALRYWR